MTASSASGKAEPRVFDRCDFFILTLPSSSHGRPLSAVPNHRLQDGRLCSSTYSSRQRLITKRAPISPALGQQQTPPAERQYLVFLIVKVCSCLSRSHVDTVVLLTVRDSPGSNDVYLWFFIDSKYQLHERVTSRKLQIRPPDVFSRARRREYTLRTLPSFKCKVRQISSWVRQDACILAKNGWSSSSRETRYSASFSLSCS